MARETSYMDALMARPCGNNNLPDRSNMRHGSTSFGLPKSIGVPVGTVQLEDFELWHHAVGSQVPAYKAIPIRLSPM